jgi:hypothetical protein
MTAAYIYPQLPLLFLVVGYGNNVPFLYRIVVPLVIQAGIMALLAFVAPTSIWATLVLVFGIGITTAVVQSSGFAFARHVTSLQHRCLCMNQGYHSDLLAAYFPLSTPKLCYSVKELLELLRASPTCFFWLRSM